GATYRDFRVPLEAKMSKGNTLGVASIYTALQRSTSGLLSLNGVLFAADASTPFANPMGWDVSMNLAPLPDGQYVRDGEMPFAINATIRGERGVTLNTGRGFGAAALTGASAYSNVHADGTTDGPDPVLALAAGGAYAGADFAVAPGMVVSAGFTERR